MKGTLYLIPNTLGPSEFDMVLPRDVVELINSLDYFIVENDKTARAFIKSILPEKNQRVIVMEILDKQTDPLDLPLFLAPSAYRIGYGMQDIGNLGFIVHR